MATITTRSGKGTPLTNDEVDANFNNLNTGKLEITSSTGSATVPKGTTAQRDGSPATGMFRYNSTLEEFEGYTDNGWIGIGDGLDSATVLSIAASKGISITAGAGLTGGGTLASTRDLAVGAGTGITVNANDIATNDGAIVHDNLSGFVANEHIDHSGVSITAGIGLKGGGTIASTRDLAVDSAELIAYYNSSLVHDNLSGFVANEHIDHSGVSVTAGAGLTGGGTIAATRTINVVGGTGITANANDIATNDGEIVHDNLSGFVANEHIDHSGVSVTAGIGLKGGGTIAATRDLAIDSAELIANYNASIVHDNLSGFVADEHIAHGGVEIIAGAGMTGGGTIAASRALNVIAGTGITVNANDIATNDGAIVHDNLSGFVANEHIDHSGVTITAGAGMTGGGTIESTRTLNVIAGTGITVNANDVTTNDGQIVHDNLSGFVANEHIDHSGVSVVAGAGMTGGGTIASNRTLNVIGGAGIDVSADDVHIDSASLGAHYSGEIVHDNTSGFVANEHIDHTGVTLTAGAGLTGGGTIAANRTFTVGAGTGVTVNANDVAIGQAVGTTDSVTFAGLYSSGNVVIGGNLQVDGTQTTINSTTVQIDDKLFTLGDAAADSSGMNAGGIELSTTGGANPSILYFASGDKFQTNKNWDVQGNIVLTGTVDGVDVAGLEGRSIVAGAGMTGGGTLGASRTLNVIAGTGITVNADNITTNDGAIVHDNLSGFVANEHIDHSGVSVTAGFGLSGGGTIAATRDIKIDSAELLAYFNGSIVHDNLSGFVGDEHIDHGSVSVTAGAGMTGGGTIASTRTLNVIAGTGITVNADNVATNDGAIVHDNLSGFVANEHIDHSGVSVTAGFGLKGGGTIASTRDLAIDSAELLAYYNGSIVHDNLSGFVANEHIDHSGVSVTAGDGLTGGGTIAATRTINVVGGTGITANANDIATNDGEIVHDNLSGFVANEHIDHSGVSVVAGAGMTGGGTIAASRTLNVIAGTGITVNANDIQTNDGAIVHDNLSGFVANEHIDHSSITFTAGTGLSGGGTLAANRTFNVSGVTSSMFSSPSTVLIKNASGTTLKTILSPGS